MEQHRDEQITCASCGTSFLFSAADASARAERGLTKPPTLCKECWREKKAKSAPSGDAPRGDAQQNRPPRRHGEGRDHRPRPTRFTGDVNEYRSPMADPHFASYPSYGRRTFHPAGQTPRPRVARDDGNYRAPSGGQQGQPRGPRPSGSHGPSRSHGFPITCAACGTSATVPFKPNENQKVYCKTCYRAEKPT